MAPIAENAPALTAVDVIRLLDLKPHPEGGHFRETFRDLRTLADGREACVTVTLLDAMVLARSAFESSMQYRSAMVFGVLREVDDKIAALRAMSEQWLPGRWEELRPPTRKELAATTVLEMPLVEWSVKIGAAPPEDESCSCNMCPFMRKNTLEKLYLCMRDLQPQVDVPEETRIRALKPIQRMLEMSA